MKINRTFLTTPMNKHFHRQSLVCKVRRGMYLYITLDNTFLKVA
jgi:hypothetical protein